MREAYQEELRLAQSRGVLSQEEADSLLAEGLRLGRPPLELLVERGVLSEETLASIKAAAHGAMALEGQVQQHDATRTFAGLAAQPSPRLGGPLAPERPAPQGRRDTGKVEALSLEPAFPVPGWERYQPERFLGQGGMGRVYLAYDTVLRRSVALKFVRGDDPECLRRFLSEAQAQARVEHERVCKVYEVGEVQGQPFISMQYVNGRSLLEVARELSLEQKVMVVQQATEGVHAAHRAGLIHRDIKPSNILVERAEDGQLKPYVMDFGLARDWQQESTVTGTVLGTPQYMAPEQARGEVSRLDRRADVYSLGATLYTLLTGHTPIPGSNPLEVLSNIATHEPRPLRALDRNVPADLEAIVLKCLEREPSARYDSARALAEDLGRFLNGEPVQARAVGVWYRLRKRARKHRVLVSMATAALVLVGLALGQVLLTRRELGLREQLARHFAEQAADVGARARFIALSRLHDTSAERQVLRTKLEALEQEVQQGGELALGPGNHTLGLGWLELGEPARARKHLEIARQHGFQEDPSTASALAMALGQLYNEQLLSLGSLLPEGRQARRGELARLYRDPALALLRQSQGAPVLSREYMGEYMQALLAFYEERHEEALARLQALEGRLPWLYEAPKLRGDILHMRALVRWGSGERAHVQAELEAAQRAYAQAADTAPSVPEVHYGLARVEWAALSMQSDSGGEVQPHVERALEHLSRALAVAPHHAPSWVLRATLYRRLAEHQDKLGGGGEELLRQAVEAARRALELDPSLQEARKELGMDWWQWANIRQRQGLDQGEQLRQALAVFEGFKPDERDYYVYNSLGLIFQSQADSESPPGAEALRSRDKAIEALLKAVELAERSQLAWRNLANAYLKRAQHPRALGVEEDLARAGQALERARALNPRSWSAWFRSAMVHSFQAQWLHDKGEDERPALAAALEACRQGLALNPGEVSFYNLQGAALQAQARGAWERGEDAMPLLAQAQRAYEQARDKAPRAREAYNNLADVHAQRAVYLHALNQEARPSARAAQQAAHEALQLTPGSALALTNLGRASQLLALFTLQAQGDPRPHLAEATHRLHQALEQGPGRGEAWLYLAETLAVQARWQARQGQAVDKHFEEAAQAFERALELAEWPLDYRLAFGRFCLEWATWRQQAGLEPARPLERGLALAGEVLAARPLWAEAQVLRANLQGLSRQPR